MNTTLLLGTFLCGACTFFIRIRLNGIIHFGHFKVITYLNQKLMRVMFLYFKAMKGQRECCHNVFKSEQNVLPLLLNFYNIQITNELSMVARYSKKRLSHRGSGMVSNRKNSILSERLIPMYVVGRMIIWNTFLKDPVNSGRGSDVLNFDLYFSNFNRPLLQIHAWTV